MRLKDISIFVAVVWSVAASFVAFEFVALRGMDVALAHPSLFGPILLSSATKTSTACEVDPAAAKSGPPGVDPAVVRGASWTLGQRVGRDAQARMSTTVTPEVLSGSAQGIAQLAGALGVPPPARFAPVQVLSANTEFVRFIESDGDKTAHQLAVAYSPDACRLYKLGAFWAYAGLVRMNLPGERNIYAVEINHYATLLGLSSPLWQPFVERTPANATMEQINRETTELTGEITKHLMKPGG